MSKAGRKPSFDHREATKRWLNGETLQRLATEFGVTRQAVHLAVRKFTDEPGRTGKRPA